MMRVHVFNFHFYLTKDFDKAEKSIFWGPVMHCLITDNHTIPIGEFTFKDWED